MEIHASITVQGLVQGVGYRWFANRHAVALGLKGFVRNNYDGTVYVEAEGDRSLIEELIVQLKIGPRSAQVKDLAVEWSDAKNLFLGFSIR
ncbi:MAG TPA: acylphosphatase [Bacteroidota bacterium]|nr:acylphosphatase [Bacteroidota bacterium]